MRYLAAVAVLMVATGCASSDASPGTPAQTSGAPTTVSVVPATNTAPPTSAQPAIPDELSAFGTGSVSLDGRVLDVAIADDTVLRPQGLMAVTDLGPLDGMLFVWPEDTNSSFWMYNTPMRLDIAWFDADGRFVSQTTMELCGEMDSCPDYEADGPYRYALEVPAGQMPVLGPGSLLEIISGA